MTMTAGEENFLLVEREDVRTAVLTGDNIEAVVVRVGLAVEREEHATVLQEIADRLLHEAVAEVSKHDEIDLFDLRLEFAEQAINDRLFRRIGIDEVDAEKFA